MYYAPLENQAKIPHINWWRILLALGFHQEQMGTMEDSTEILKKNQDSKGRISQDWFCIKLYIIYLTHCIQNFPKLKIRERKKFLLQVLVIIQKFKIQKSLL